MKQKRDVERSRESKGGGNYLALISLSLFFFLGVCYVE